MLDCRVYVWAAPSSSLQHCASDTAVTRHHDSLGERERAWGMVQEAWGMVQEAWGMARVMGAWAAVLGAWVMERAWAVAAERVVGMVGVALPRTL